MIIDWLNEHLLPCSIKAITGFDCPGCGIQRSFIALLKGDISASVQLYPALMFQLSTFIFTLLHLIFKFKHGAEIIKWLFILSAAITFAAYFYKLAHK